MKETILIVLLLSNLVLNQVNYDGNEAHELVLNDASSTIDGTTLTETAYNGVSILDGENIIHYEKEYGSVSGYGEATDESEMHSIEECNKEKLVTISEAGIYIVSGTLTGQLAIELPDSDSTQSVTLVLKGVTINCSVAPGLIFYNVYEIDSTEYEDSGTSITYSAASSLDFTNAGAKVIIADDTTNTVTGSHVAKCYKYTVNSDGSITVTTSKRAKYDGAFYSKMSMSIKGETNGNGVLNIIADNEGLDTEKHLLIESGKINIASQDDGINTNEEGGSVTLIKGGTLTINGGLGTEGDGIDSNGYLLINGGTVTLAGRPQADSGMDADLGVIINGGTTVAVGSSMDGASTTSSQPTMNLQFSSQMSSISDLIVKDSSGNTLVTFNPSSAGFVDGTEIRTYQGAIISHPSFELNGVYYLYLGDTQLGYSGQGGQQGPGGQNMPGTPPDNEGGNNGTSRTPPENEGGNNGIPGTPPENEGGNNGTSRTPPENRGGNNGTSRTPPDNGGGNNGTSGTPENGGGGNNGQPTNTGSMTKEFTLSSAATTFTGVGVYSESNLGNNNNNVTKDDDDNDDDNDNNDDNDDNDTSPGIATYIAIGVASIVLLSAFIPLLGICLI